ncbi:MAG: hypothetical protein NVSMB19_06370 [Vulcanimicrobiaceae bacterium]
MERMTNARGALVAAQAAALPDSTARAPVPSCCMRFVVAFALPVAGQVATFERREVSALELGLRPAAAVVTA